MFVSKKSMKKRLSPDHYIDGILAHDRFILSRAITVLESSLPSDQEISRQILQKIMPYTGKSYRIGITGVPGVGKSTFIEEFGIFMVENKQKLAVLAIDPSSQKTGGSIMGDKTRMESLANHPNVYVRPSPAGNSLGGVSQKTRETMLLCEAAGFDTIFIETVGVGQSETAVSQMVDFFLLLMLSGAGDELQGIKKGIMEMADLLLITKADGDNERKAQKARIEYQNALHVFAPQPSGWFPKVLTCSATKRIGFEKILETMYFYRQKMTENGFWDKKRGEQNQHWLHSSIKNALHEHFYQSQLIKTLLPEIEKEVEQGKTHAFLAAYELLKRYESN